MTAPVEAVLIGAGQRGAAVYGAYALAHPDQMRFVAVAEPDPERRAQFAAQHRIPPERQFSSWEPLLAGPRLGQAALVCTQDWLHTAPALATLEAGYDVLLEKPMATTARDCRRLVQASERTGRQLHICHVLRYTRHFQTMRALIRSGALGQVVNVTHRENVSWWHMAHSFVRGNWRSREQSSPMILAKCCHDFDILLWLLDRRCEALSSFGALSHFRAENAPQGAPEHCLDGCPVSETCPYYAPFIYMDLFPLFSSFAETARGVPAALARARQRAPGLFRALAVAIPSTWQGVARQARQLGRYDGWPVSVVARDPTPENLLAALRKGPYGRCVYRCDNDVVDHQVVAMQFEGRLSVTLTMHGHAHIEGRSTRIEGTRGSLTAFFGIGGSWIEVREHRTGRRQRHDTGGAPGEGHGGGDQALMEAFVHSLRTGGGGALTTARQSLESHLMALAAEQARLEGRVLHREAWAVDADGSQGLA